MVLLTQLLLARRVRLVALVALPLLLVRMSAFAAPIVWNDPVNISNNVNPVAEDGLRPNVAAVGDALHAVWVEKWATVLYARSLDGGQTWQDEYPLGTTSAGGAPEIAASGSAVIAIWLGADGVARSANSPDAGATWSMAQDVSVATPALPHGVVLDAGAAAVIWSEGTVGAGVLRMSRSQDNGTTWDAPTNIGPATPYASIAVAGSTLVVAYREDNTLTIRSLTSTDWGVTWPTPSFVYTEPSSPVSWLRLAASGASAVAVWHAEGPIHAAASGDAGVTWQTPEVLSVDAGGAPLSGTHIGDVCVSGSSAVAVWRMNNGAPFDLYSRRSVDGGLTWAAVEVISALDAGYPRCDASDASVYVVTETRVGDDVWAVRGSDTAAAIDVTPPSLDFSSVPVGSTDTRTFDIISTGTATLSVTTIASANAVFTVTTTPPAPFDLAAEDPDLSQTITVTFTPIVEGLQTADITISHNAAGGSTVVTASGSGVAEVSDGVTIVDAQAAAGTEVTIPVDIYDTSALTPGVTGIDLTVTYDETLLTPTSDAGGFTSASVTALTTGWSVAQNVVTPGELEIVMGAEFAGELAAGGTILNLTFSVDAAAVTNTASPVGLSRALLNEGLVSATAVEGTFTVVNFMYGDVTGNGAWSGYDASHVLEHAARGLVSEDHTFPIETTAPVWAPLPLPEPDADTVADVDGDGEITANDASLVLQRAVSIITAFPVETAAPSALPIAVGRPLRASATSQRPGARITVSLDTSALSDLRAGELVLDFDSAVLRPVDVALRPQDASGATQPPLLTQREGDGRIAVAFAAARPLGASDALLEITFEASRHISHAQESAIQASHLRLNRSRIDTGFAFPFRLEPFQTRLMANYPNPFNPETWIPFELAEDTDVTVRVYGLDGTIVRTLDLGRRSIGEYRSRA